MWVMMGDVKDLSQRRKSTKECLGIHSGCVDAHVEMWGFFRREERFELALDWWNRGIEHGLNLMPHLRNASQVRWSDMDNRPYMRAVQVKALALSELGKTWEAAMLIKLLLQWNPNDNQGVRALCYSWCAEIGDLSFLRSFYRRYLPDPNATSAGADEHFLHLWFGFRDKWCESELYKRFLTATKVQPWITRYLLWEGSYPAEWRYKGWSRVA